MFLFLILLAVIQGLTEFLPVSSSGHLVILQNIFPDFDISGMDNPFIIVMLHLGTLGAVILFYRQKILVLIKGTAGYLYNLIKERNIAALKSAGQYREYHQAPTWS